MLRHETGCLQRVPPLHLSSPGSLVPFPPAPVVPRPRLAPTPAPPPSSPAPGPPGCPATPSPDSFLSSPGSDCLPSPGLPSPGLPSPCLPQLSQSAERLRNLGVFQEIGLGISVASRREARRASSRERPAPAQSSSRRCWATLN